MVAALITGQPARAIEQRPPADVSTVPIFVNEPQFVACRKNAKAVEGKGAIGVCLREDHDDGLMYSSVPYVETIIYDSTDEIYNKAPLRSKPWKDTARSLARQAPFGIYGFHAKSIGGHYYEVTFDAQDKPDCCW
jgi:hypothetical protein